MHTFLWKATLRKGGFVVENSLSPFILCGMDFMIWNCRSVVKGSGCKRDRKDFLKDAMKYLMVRMGFDEAELPV